MNPSFHLFALASAALVVRIVRDVGVAEDVVQDAVVTALQSWPAEGVPDRPGAWLLVTARRKSLFMRPPCAGSRTALSRRSETINSVWCFCAVIPD